MVNRKVILALLSSAIVITSAPDAAADGGSAFVGGLLGGAIGSAIVNHQQQRRVVVQRGPRAPAVSSYQREENRRAQTALNYFGFPAGVADGVMGRNSRSAVGQYQAFMGYPPTGELSDYERVFLTSAYERAIVGGPQTAQLIATNGQGVRGLLLAYRQEQMGVPPAVAAAPVVPVAPLVVVPQTVEAAAPAPEPPAPAATEVAVVAEPPAGSAALPSFLAGPAGVSMASYCNRVNLATSTNGGFATLAAMSDPMQALGEQFCLARTYAVEQGDSLAGTVQGFSMAEMEAQCEAFAPSMWEYQARLVTQSPEEAVAALQDFVVATGAPPAQLSGNARICLGIGYKSDNAELALAAAMVLVGLGEEAYGEMLGHHLINGFAAPKRPDRGLEWLGVATAALGAGASPLVPAGAEARLALLDQAVLTLSGAPPRPVLQDAGSPPAGQGFVLPTPQPQSN